jgi:hypothetical protein
LTKQNYIHYSLNVVICLPLHVHITMLEMFFFFFLCAWHHGMTKKIGLPIMKLSENTSFYPIMGQTKTKKLLFIGSKTIHNVTILRHHIIQFLMRKKRRCNIPFNSINKEVLSILSELVINWQEPLVIVKKNILLLFVSMNTLLFSIQYEHASFPCVLQPKTIL